ncbi:radical SAM protein [Hydrogenimonas thermophila]|uniref:radical SAM protein n=1 Tax=Hydrogenimonas thermophila TaxID=223786 RepID=UPI0029372A32|nr:radical SAM protein [Hydrogenimonas thermophila]WOE70032.1 radical SAM protein [Hydrogenimonas thermophila]WOE72549.1 radical SAM protein [Hydrogenimonas thermophila]
MYKIDDLVYPISRFCPGKCLNCNIYQEDPHIENETSIELFEKILQSKVLKDTFYFSLTGGESQLSNKFIPVLELIAKYKPKSYIHSNTSGWHTKRTIEVAQKGLELFDKDRFRIDISVDGIKEDYERVRLTKDGWKKAMNTTKELLKLGLKPTFVMIVYKQNYKSIKKFVEMCHEKGVGWYIGFFVESDNFNNKGKVKYYTNQEIDEIETSLYEIGFMDSKHYVNWLWAKSVYLGNIPEFKCMMGSRSLLIDPYGNVYPCGGGQEKRLNKMLYMGNIKDYNGNLDRLLNDKKALKVLDNIKQKKCQPCDLLCAHKIEFPWGKGTGL